MKTRAIEPAVLGWRDAPGGPLPFSPLYGDIYHAEAGALEQARVVFLAGNGLPGRWAGRERFVVLETGFGLGHNFLATWAAWQGDAARCERLLFISIEKHPLSRADLRAALASGPCGSDANLHALAGQLAEAWPPLTPNLHTLCFEGGRVQLLLALGDVADLLPGLLAEVDAFYLDGFAPERNPQMWRPDLLQRLGRLAAPGATAATWSAAGSLREALRTAGFEVEKVPGFAGKRHMVRARHMPRHRPTPPPGGLLQPQLPAPQRRALVIGGGLAGCAAAWGLAEQGWASTVIDRHPEPAAEASGNPAGLFHGIVNADDGPHARAHRAAALHTAAVLGGLPGGGLGGAAPGLPIPLAGACDGLLRLEPRLNDADATALLQRLGLPPDYVNWLTRDDAARASGLPVSSGGWWFARGGWVCPGDYARALLWASGASWLGGRTVATLRHEAGQWLALDEHGAEIARAPVLVLAAAGDSTALANAAAAAWAPDTANPAGDAAAAALAPLPHAPSPHAPPPRANTPRPGAPQAAPPLSTPQPPALPAPLPLGRVRGQVSWLPADQPGLRPPLCALAGQGYALPPVRGRACFGATTQSGDEDPAVREADHRYNLARLAALGAWADAGTLPPSLGGRVGWRATTPDRLPLVGALPVSANPRLARQDQPRFVPRARDATGGVYLLSGLGSRGISWAALGGRLLASWVTGNPCPVEADLRDALDPARFVARKGAVRRAL